MPCSRGLPPACSEVRGHDHIWEPVDDGESDADICLRCGCVREPAHSASPAAEVSEPGSPSADPYTYRQAHFYVTWFAGRDARTSPLQSQGISDAIREARAKSYSLPDDDGTEIAYDVRACHCDGKACEMHRDGTCNIFLHSGTCARTGGGIRAGRPERVGREAACAGA